MNNLELQIQQMTSKFAKKAKPPKWRAGNNIVNYTRVSDPSQYDNTSLETQKKDAISYAVRRSFDIKAFFGGEAESAKTDERKEFKRMLDFVKKNKDIVAILVYSYERFSRSEHAQQLILDLSKIGVKVISVLQDIDVTTSSGKLQQNIFLAFGNYDNELRRSKSMRGTLELIEQGYYIGHCPFGYTNLKRKEKAKYHEFVINEEGKFLKMGYKWKAEGKWSNQEIVDRLRGLGSKIEYKSFYRIIANPFYCGYFVNAYFPGKLIKGHHPTLVSMELFMKANAVAIINPHKGIARKFKDPDMPLKSFLRSELTGSPFTGYKQKGHIYYKTRGHAEPVNEKASTINKLFMEELDKYKIDETNIPAIEEQVKQIVTQKFSDNIQEDISRKRKITDLELKVEQLEERFVNQDLTKELYEKYRAKYELEKAGLEAEIGKSDLKSSDLEKAVKNGLEILIDPLQLWVSSDYDDKQRLQYLLFPEGMRYDKQNKRVRTPKVNGVVSLISSVARVSEENKKGYLVKSSLDSRFVERTGIEPVLPG
jgi:site-specific DNA recombinase